MTVEKRTILTEDPVALSDLQGLFGGSNPTNLSEYYLSGANIQPLSSSTYGSGIAGTYAPNVPTSGEISLDDFKGVNTAYTYTQGTSPVITGIAVSISTAGNLTSFLPAEKRSSGKTFKICIQLRSETGWQYSGYQLMTGSFTYGTSKTQSLPVQGSKFWVMYIAYTGADSFTIGGYYTGDGTDNPYGGCFVQGVVATA